MCTFKCHLMWFLINMSFYFIFLCGNIILSTRQYNNDPTGLIDRFATETTPSVAWTAKYNSRHNNQFASEMTSKLKTSHKWHPKAPSRRSIFARSQYCPIVSELRCIICEGASLNPNANHDAVEVTTKHFFVLKIMVKTRLLIYFDLKTTTGDQKE
jgi:hypothetical protein